jgi:Family of unknown function (DUF6152)
MRQGSRTLRRWAAAITVAAVLGTAGTVAAHHGWGSYDADRPVTVTGPLTQVTFGNPHVDVRVQAADKTWEVILAPVSRMEARGATADVVQVGKTITAYGYPSREHADEMRAERITIDGRTYEMR